jgi:hydroxyacylglutathione hydrolase
VVGYLGLPLEVMADNPDKVRQASRLTAGDFEQRRAELDNLQIVDVRNPGEIKLGSIEGAFPVPVGQLPGRTAEFDPDLPTVVFCAGGYRSSVAASVLRNKGFTDVSDILGGYGAWIELTPAST